MIKYEPAMGGHIVKSFDEDLGAIENLVAEMGRLAGKQYKRAMKVLTQQKTGLVGKVFDMDERVDSFESRIDAHAVQILALRQPVADDLRLAIVVMRISSDLGRIGDYAKSIAKWSGALGPVDRFSGVAEKLQDMHDGVGHMIADSLEAFRRRDLAEAAAVRRRHQDVRQLYGLLLEQALEHMKTEPQDVPAGVSLLLTGKSIERIALHAANIAKQVPFLVNGVAPEHWNATVTA